MRYMLITVIDREIMTELFDSKEEAVSAMKKEMTEEANVPIDILNTYDEYEETGFGYGEESGWANGRNDCDWRIVEIPD